MHNSSDSPSSSAIAENDSHFAAWSLLHIGFILIGVVTTLLGPILPFLLRRWSLTDAQGGAFFTCQFVASTTGVVLTSYLLPRRGPRPVFVMGFCFMAAGLALFGNGGWLATLGAVALWGVGLGLTVPTTNLRGTELAPHHTASAVNLLNLSWGIGAVVSPFAVALLVHESNFALLKYPLAGLALLLAVAHLFATGKSAAAEGPQTENQASRLSLLQSVAGAFPLLAMFFLYVGAETAVGGWVATQEKTATSAGNSIWILAPSLFYGSLLAGRGIAPLALNRLRQFRVLLIGLSIATIGSAIIILANTRLSLAIGSAIAGLGMAAIYPIQITWLSRRFGVDSRRVGGFYFAAAGIGAALVPWLVGILSTSSGSLRIGLTIPLASLLLMFFLMSNASRGIPDESK